MPSTLTELMLRSPDSNNLANASLWEGHRMGGNNRGLPCSRAGRDPSPGGGARPLWVGSQELNCVPRTRLHLETGP